MLVDKCGVRCEILELGGREMSLGFRCREVVEGIGVNLR